MSVVTILHRGGGMTESANGVWEDTFKLSAPGLLIVNVSAKASAILETGNKNAGIYVQILMDGGILAIAQSFEAQTSKMTFFVSASAAEYISEVGKDYKLRVERVHQGPDGVVNKSYWLKAGYYVLAVELQL